MANPLNETDVLIVLEMLDVPAGSIVYKIDQLGLNATRVAALNGPQTAVAAIRATLGGLSSEQMQIVSDLVTAYSGYRIKLAGIKMDQGNIGDLSGGTFDPIAAMNHYKQLIRVHVPFYVDWSTMQTRAAEKEMMRCAVNC